jgi:DNA excision repair protein ERCC-2
MSRLLDDADFIIGNYYQAFDPLTKEALTAPILDGQTLVVCDEAHMLVPRVRDLLSDTLSRWSIDRARNEILSQILEQSNAGVASTMRRALAEQSIDEDDLEELVAFLSEVKDDLDRIALDDENSE